MLDCLIDHWSTGAVPVNKPKTTVIAIITWWPQVLHTAFSYSMCSRRRIVGCHRQSASLWLGRQVSLIITRAVRRLAIQNDRWRHGLLQLRLDVMYLDIYLFFVYALTSRQQLCGHTGVNSQSGSVLRLLAATVWLTSDTVSRTWYQNWPMSCGCLGCFGLFFVVLTVLYEWCQVVICLRIMPTDSDSSSYKIIIIVTRGRSNLTERPHRRVHKSCFTTRKTFNINSVKFTRLAHHYSLPVWRHRYLFKYLSCTVCLFKCRVGR